MVGTAVDTRRLNERNVAAVLPISWRQVSSSLGAMIALLRIPTSSKLRSLSSTDVVSAALHGRWTSDLLVV
jgi:hypothetical protein